jgi:polar amino acid transport system substrate-binding protein
LAFLRERLSFFDFSLLDFSLLDYLGSFSTNGFGSVRFAKMALVHFVLRRWLWFTLFCSVGFLAFDLAKIGHPNSPLLAPEGAKRPAAYSGGKLLFRFCSSTGHIKMQPENHAENREFCRLRKWQFPLFGLASFLFALPAAGAADIAAGDTLRAVYLRTNPAQAIRDPASGEVRGASASLARELAARHKLLLELKPLTGPPDVIGAVRSGAADIGFVAYEATRLGTVAFSQTYMLVRQSFLVPQRSPFNTAGEVDAAGVRVGGTRNDSITLCMKRIFKHAAVAELASDGDVAGALANGTIDAFAANRQRLTTLSNTLSDTRLLPDDLFSVPQTIIVPLERPAALEAVNAFLDGVRASGFLQRVIEDGGAIGVMLPPDGRQRYGCPG